MAALARVVETHWMRQLVLPGKKSTSHNGNYDFNPLNMFTVFRERERGKEREKY